MAHNKEEDNSYAARLVVAIIWCTLLGIRSGSLAYIIFIVLLIPVVGLLFMIFKEIWE